MCEAHELPFGQRLWQGELDVHIALGVGDEMWQEEGGLGKVLADGGIVEVLLWHSSLFCCNRSTHDRFFFTRIVSRIPIHCHTSKAIFRCHHHRTALKYLVHPSSSGLVHPQVTVVLVGGQRIECASVGVLVRRFSVQVEGWEGEQACAACAWVGDET